MRSAALAALASLSAAETLVEHIHGVDHNQLDDGFPYDPSYDLEAEAGDPGLATGYLLTDALQKTNAACLDGTAPIYYHRPGTGSGKDKWFVHQQGGGWCYDLASCVGRSQGSLGSTKADPKTRVLNSGYTSLDPESNPLMCALRPRPCICPGWSP